LVSLGRGGAFNKLIVKAQVHDATASYQNVEQYRKQVKELVDKSKSMIQDAKINAKQFLE
jgi:hypothetical protein